MKSYAVRIWLANALIVAALSTFVVVLLDFCSPNSTAAFHLAAQCITLASSALAVGFASLEAVLLYRAWKENTAALDQETKIDQETKPEESPE